MEGPIDKVDDEVAKRWVDRRRRQAYKPYNFASDLMRGIHNYQFLSTHKMSDQDNKVGTKDRIPMDNKELDQYNRKFFFHLFFHCFGMCAMQEIEIILFSRLCLGIFRHA